MKKKCTIFYSWQSDIKESRNFLSDCLKRLEKSVKPIILCDIDRDTKGLAGAPDIGDSIYEKIEVADIFIADVTIINKEFTGRKTPNPNVMIELGYAIKALGWDRIILIYNRDHGEVETLPFDINHRRMTSYSLNDEKSESRDRLVSNMKATIQILEQEHRLYGGTIESVKAKDVLVQLLKSGLRRIWDAYYAKYVLDDTLPYDQLIPISEAQISLIEELQDELTKEQYQLLHHILFYMKMSTVGNEEMYGWEFAEKLVEYCFEPLYVEYIENLQLLPYEEILKKTIIDLINVLSVEQFYEYKSKREYEGKKVFSSSEEELSVYDSDGGTLCLGHQNELGFTGYKCTKEYEGNFIDDKRDGKGTEFKYLFAIGEGRSKVREGYWKADRFVEGIVYDVLMYKKNGKLRYVPGGSGHIITKDCYEYRLINESQKNPNHEHCYLVNLRYKGGKYQIIKNSVRSKPVG